MRPPDRVTGRVSVTRRGDAFLRTPGPAPDVFVPAGRLGTAMDGDRVVVRIDRRPRGRNPEGTVLDVLERARETVVGTFHRRQRMSFVVPFRDTTTPEVLVPRREDAAEVRDGDVVVVRLRSYGDRRSRPTGSVERVLGPLSDPGVDVLAVAYGFGLSLEFDEDVLQAAKEAAEEGMADPGPDRIDRTDLLCFTIDPADAKDHDDALSVTTLTDGLVEVGVHIADVSHFVASGGPVDAEALGRGTSVYLVDRAIPMLPPVLSSDVCSLHPGADRFAISLYLALDHDGNVHDRRYERTRIRCRHALAYEDAQSVLEGRSSISPDVDEALRLLGDRARRVRDGRMARGAIDLDMPEAKVILDDEGAPVDVQKRERLESHRLIEDYMILANEVVAGDLLARGWGGLYRIHEPPSSESAAELAEALAPLGLEVPKRKSLKPSDMQGIIDRCRGEEERSFVSTLVLRSLAKARYDTGNVGHFGLASTAYTHFTSPIRRYPDLAVHRLVVAAFLGGPRPGDGDVDALQAVAERSSEREQVAEQAERATVALKKVELMERHLGDVFRGRISGVAPFGVFVTLEEYFVEGLVHVSGMEDDFYQFSAREYALVGDRKGRRYRLGDPITVQVVRVDKEARHIDFVPVRG